ncbi:MAG: hypothetical protein QOH96_1135, partial [Blastocatellia bacterium]|nr:hypothetical protein [Blastocatellia bacterium]
MSNNRVTLNLIRTPVVILVVVFALAVLAAIPYSNTHAVSADTGAGWMPGHRNQASFSGAEAISQLRADGTYDSLARAVKLSELERSKTGHQSAFSTPTAAVAAPFAEDTTIGSQEVKLAPDGAQAADEFGTSVSISGDTAIVGTFHEQFNFGLGLNTPGAAYISVRDGKKWTQQAQLTGD